MYTTIKAVLATTHLFEATTYARRSPFGMTIAFFYIFILSFAITCYRLLRKKHPANIWKIKIAKINFSRKKINMFTVIKYMSWDCWTSLAVLQTAVHVKKESSPWKYFNSNCLYGVTHHGLQCGEWGGEDSCLKGPLAIWELEAPGRGLWVSKRLEAPRGGIGPLGASRQVEARCPKRLEASERPVALRGTSRR